MASEKRPRPTQPRSTPTINPTSMYALGMLYGKGDIIFDKKKGKCTLRFGIRYKRPKVAAKRSDNLKKNTTAEKHSESVSYAVFNEFTQLRKKLKTTLDVNVDLDFLPQQIDEWDTKTIFLNTAKLDTNSPIVLELFDTTSRIDPSILQHVPNYLFDKSKTTKADVVGFLQGVADASGLPPSTTTSYKSTGKDASPRLQFELVHDRWYIPVEICRLFQRRLEIPVQGINWGHPSIRGVFTWRTQNHQFRIFAADILAGGFNFQLKFKKNSLAELLKETSTSGSKKPEKKKIFYPDAARQAKRLPLTIKKKPFNDPDIPEVLQNLHFGSFATRRMKLKKVNKYKFTKKTDAYSTYEKEKKLFKQHKKGIKSDAAALQIYNKLKQKSFPLGPNTGYND